MEVISSVVYGKYNFAIINAGQNKQGKSMVRIIVGVVAGFLVWVIVWVGTEQVFSALWPDWFGAHLIAFTAAIKNGGQFTADTTILLMQIVMASLVSVLAGYVAALIARETKRAPLILGILLAAFGLLKVVMSWPYVPLWHHVILMALLFPMTILGGKLKAARSRPKVHD